jgi:hypothetical protein
MTADPVLAFGTARNNAELIEHAARLGYLESDWRILDPTFGLGRFWRRFQPANLVAHDIDPDRAPDGPADFRHLPYADESFDAVVLDPPYKLNGAAGSHPSDDNYGVGERASVGARHALIRDGITEAARVVRPARRVRVDRGRTELVGGIVLIKCQDQVNARAIRWQRREFADHAETVGLDLIDELHLLGYRPQPARTRRHGECAGAGCAGCTDGRVESRQEHAARNYSTLLVTRKAPQ